VAEADYSEISLVTFRDRYSHDGEQYPHQAWMRLAKAVATLDGDDPARVQEYFGLLEGFKFVPGGRIMRAIGTDSGETAQNCYVIPCPEDSRAGIVGKSLMEWVEIQSKGGGVGVNISSLRPSGDRVHGVNGTSSGPVTWAQLFAYVSHDIVIQGGSRRGAAMIMMNDDHPDIFEFIHAKEKPGRLEGCNMSVCISDAFMAAVEVNGDWDLKWGGRVYRTVKARQIWDEIIDAAWRSAEPGIYFMERANKEANSGYFEELISTNPCGEQPLGPYGACLLGSFNLRAFVRRDGDGAAHFDFDEFERWVPVAVRFQDNVIDLSSYPLEECRDSQRRIRRMGIGVMGLADALLDMRLRYGSPEAIEFTERVCRSLRDSAYRASAALAAERGPFPEYVADEYLKRPFIKRLPSDVRAAIRQHGIRNCYLLTQAPTGTIALMAGVNSGIEPYFDFKYFRKDRIGEYWVKSDWSDEYDAVETRPAHLVTSMDVTPEEHVLMQAAAQASNDSSISKTANLPNSATRDDVDRLYRLAYKHNLKSLSVYRDGSRSEQALYTAASQADDEVIEQVVVDQPRQSRRRLPDDRQAFTHKFNIDGVEGYLTFGLYDDGTPGEMFLNISKQGSTVNGLADAFSMVTSFALQWGCPIFDLADKWTGISFEPAGPTGNRQIPFATSLVDYVGRKANQHFGGSTAASVQYDNVREFARNGDVCPSCGSSLRRAEGCAICPNCTYSKCG